MRVKGLVFLGGGRITGALVAGLRRAGYDKPIVVHDRHAHKLRLLERKYGTQGEADLDRALQQAHLLIVAVRPDSVGELLAAMGRIDRSLIAVSLAAGVPLARLRARLGPPVRWARAMPSPLCRSGRGLTAVAFEPELSRAARHDLHDLFARLGPVLEIPETQFDAFTVTYSCSHGFHALAALASTAEKLGLDPKNAWTAAAHALADGILAWRESNIPLHRLLREAATPGGIAATVMSSMSKAGYERAVERGLRAGMARAQTNTKQ